MDRPMNLAQWGEYVDGARAAAVKLIDEYVRARKPTKADMPYLNAELAYITASKDNMWKWLQSDGKFHYRNHVRDKKGKLICVEAYLP